jgi:hypothetical protein
LVIVGLPDTAVKELCVAPKTWIPKRRQPEVLPVGLLVNFSFALENGGWFFKPFQMLVQN